MTPEQCSENLAGRIDELDADWEGRHTGLRTEFREMTQRMNGLSKTVEDQEREIGRLKDRPIDSGNIRFTGSVVMTIVGVVASVIISQLAITSGVRSDLRDNTTKIEAQVKIQASQVETQNGKVDALKQAIEFQVSAQNSKVDSLRQAIDLQVKMQEAQMAAQNTKIDAMGRAQQLQQINIQDLRELIVKQGVK